MKSENNMSEGIVIGRNPVIELLNAKKNIDFIYVAKGCRTGSIRVALAKAKEMGITVKEVDNSKLNALCEGQNHQGIIASMACKNYVSVDDIINNAKEKNEPPFIIIADGIEDPHNFGAIIRTAECVGVHGIIIAKRRSVGLNYTVSKTSAGAIEYVSVAKVTNIVSTIEDLKKRGVWVYGMDMDGETWCSTDLKGPIALVLGSEGNGISRIVKEKCDGIISLPMLGKINSLNVSVAAGLGMYEVCRQRMGLKTK